MDQRIFQEAALGYQTAYETALRNGNSMEMAGNIAACVTMAYMMTARQQQAANPLATFLLKNLAQEDGKKKKSSQKPAEKKQEGEDQT